MTPTALDTIPEPTPADRTTIVLDAMYMAWNDGTKGWDDDVLGVIRLLASARRRIAELEAAEKQKVVVWPASS